MSLGVSLNQKHWDFSKQQPKPSCPNREYIEKLVLAKKGQYQDKIIELTAFHKDYTPQSLVDMIENAGKQTSLADLYIRQIKAFTATGRIGNAKVYSYSFRSLEKFTGGKTAIPLHEITPVWLKNYEEWLKSRNCGETTISQLFRTLRSIWNKAIDEGIAMKEAYPFDKFKVSKFDTTTKKRAISKDNVKKIIELDLSGEGFYTQFSRDVFLFSYLGAGINFTDIAHLKHSNIQEGRIVYCRKKTGKEVSFRLSDEIRNIIERYSSIAVDGYLFPILTKNHKTPIQISNRIHKVLGHVNRQLKRIGGLVGVDGLTTYVSRHSYATVLKKSGVNISIISESLGHSDLSTTQIYLDSFDNEQIDEAMKNLL